MKKVNLSISLITQSEHQEYNLTGEIDENNNRLIYVEPSTNIRTVIDRSAKRIIRESDHYRMILYFNEEERVEIILKVEAKMLEVKIKTLIYESNENHFHVKYQLIEANEEVEYIIDSDEVKE
ncbi:MAG TPA: hypothetical protein IAB56_06800 [Candidatus Scybalousia intestinigallinarum]|nr:hypothetical protein [Candidatus Scybalousia intestinigallinarum]